MTGRKGWTEIDIRPSRYQIALVAVTLVACYLVYGGILLVFESDLVYFPDDTAFEDCGAFSSEQMHTYNGTRFYRRDGEGPLVLMYHGNAGRACDRAGLMERLHDGSYVLVEYTGYAEPGEPSKQAIEQDVRNMVGWLEEQDRSAVVMGTSLGGAPASYHASLTDTAGLLLVNPFYAVESWMWSLSGLYPDSFITEDYDNAAYLSGVNDRILILHATNDQVIDPAQSGRLARELDLERRMIPDSGHNSIYGSDRFQEMFRSFVQNATMARP